MNSHYWETGRDLLAIKGACDVLLYICHDYCTID